MIFTSALTRIRRGETMNKAARMLVMSGTAAVAALAFSAGPAAASSDSPASTASKSTTQAADKHGVYRSKVVGYYRSPIQCNRAGKFGEWRNRWDDYTCFRVPFGPKRGWFALQVRWDNHGFPGQGHVGFPGHHGPGFPGQHGPGFPGQHGPGFPGHPHGPGFPGNPHFPTKK
jgi:hypothetical protein